MLDTLLVSVKPKAKPTQLSTSPEELQSFLLEDLPPTPMEPKSQLIPQLLLPPPLPILLPKELQSSKTSLSPLSPMSDMLDTVDGHMLTTLESVKLIPMLIFSSQEEPQSPLLELSPPMLTELLYQLIPQL